jgi:tetratricopeptide (TPR) repeat protein
VRSAALQARFNWGRALQFQGDSERAREQIEISLALAREVGDRRIESTTLAQLGILAFQRGRYGEARNFYRQALAMARAIGDRAVESGVINNLGEAETVLGNYEAAFELLQTGRRVCREIGQRMADAYLLCNMAHVAFLRGDAAAALGWSDQARDLAQGLNDPDLSASLLCTRGHVHAALGQRDAATACYRESVSIYHEIGRPTMPPEPIAGLARLALAREAVVEAMHLVADIVVHFDAGGTVDGTEDPLWIYLTCHEVMRATASPRADEFLARAHALLMQRAEPLEPAERGTFLGNVPSHQAIVAAWAARAGAAA